MIARLLFSALTDLARRPLATAASLLAVAATVLLCGIIALGATVLDGALEGDQGLIRFQVYWKPGADPGLVARQWDWMRALPGLAEAKAFTPEAALEVMRSSLGKDAELTFAPGQNPLPYTMLLAFRPPEGEADFAKTMYDRLLGVEGVAEVRFNPLAVDATRTLGTLLNRVGPPLGLMLVLLVGLVVGTTVRLSLVSRRAELEILRLVGATEGYIRWPLALGSGIVGLAGGILGLGLLRLLQSFCLTALDLPPRYLPQGFLPTGLVLACVLAAGCVSALAGLIAALEPTS